jgi:hypothetical protein
MQILRERKILKLNKMNSTKDNSPIDGLLDTLRSIANNYPEWNPHKEKYDCQIDAQGAIDKFHKAQPQTSTPIEADEPYFGWCDVDGCENEACGGGSVWQETGYWKSCYKHSDDYRKGLPQPKMKQKSIDRENSRGEDGILPSPESPVSQPQPVGDPSHHHPIAEQSTK